MPGPAAQRLGHLGVGGFTYDALDNPRTSAIGARSLSHNFDAATNRLTSLSGSQNIAFRYDANGKTCLSWLRMLRLKVAGFIAIRGCVSRFSFSAAMISAAQSCRRA